MGIKIYNTLIKKKEEFRPIQEGKVGMYVCGVTVYDECHIGHLRGAFTFDIVRRYLEYKSYTVMYVRNITDVDDKIIEKAKSEIRNPKSENIELRNKVREVAERYTKSYYDDIEAFGIRRADIEPKATEHIPDMIRTIEELIKKGYAYAVNNDVYFEVRKFDRYGSLSGQSLDEMEAGARVDINEHKKDPLDFALWKASGPDEPSWDSPWGQGRPGWHIECSCMSAKYLGESFDIHGGGLDLMFPHHENEIAQSECAAGRKFAHYWMHNGLLTINGTKMAKSLGNYVSIKDLLKKYHPDVVKIFFLSSHYRSPVDFTYERMEEATRARERFCILLDKFERVKSLGSRVKEDKIHPPPSTLHQDIDSFRMKFEDAMDDDFNTAEALAVLFDMVTYINKELIELSYAKDMLLELSNVLGLFEHYKDSRETINVAKKAEIEALIRLRDEARSKKNFTEADRIRKELSGMGVVIEDTKTGTVWRMK